MNIKTKYNIGDEVWSGSIHDTLLIDRFKYKGHGRPMKSDYITVSEATRKYNSLFNAYLDVMRKKTYTAVKLASTKEELIEML